MFVEYQVLVPHFLSLFSRFPSLGVLFPVCFFPLTVLHVASDVRSCRSFVSCVCHLTFFSCLRCGAFPHQAQAVEFEQSLATRVAELKANALAQEAAVREQEQLDAKHAARLQVRLVPTICVSVI